MNIVFMGIIEIKSTIASVFPYIHLLLRWLRWVIYTPKLILWKTL